MTLISTRSALTKIFLAAVGAMLCLQPAVAKETKTVRIAMCQIMALDSDRPGNFLRIEEALKEAKKQKAQIACLPETTVLGWVNPDAHKMAHPIPGDDSKKLCELAKKYGMYVCVGLCEKDGEKLHDTVILIDPKGEILLKHRKINILTKLMTPPYTPGKDVGVVDTEFGKIGMLICADTFRKSICLRMEKLHPDLVLVPYGWAAKPDSWPGHGKALEKVVRRAADWIGAPVVGTDLVGQVSTGPFRKLIYGGASVSVAPDGKILALGKDRQRDVKVFSLQLPHQPNKDDVVAKTP